MKSTRTSDLTTLIDRLLEGIEAPEDGYAKEPPAWAKDPFNGDDAERCGLCGSWCEVVRPGKTQCPHCWDDGDRAVRIRAATAISDMAARMARLEDALEPFAAVEWADDEGWSYDAPFKDRICDWFGPSDFRNARRARNAQDGDLRRAGDLCNVSDGATDDHP